MARPPTRWRRAFTTRPECWRRPARPGPRRRAPSTEYSESITLENFRASYDAAGMAGSLRTTARAPGARARSASRRFGRAGYGDDPLGLVADRAAPRRPGRSSGVVRLHAGRRRMGSAPIPECHRGDPVRQPAAQARQSLADPGQWRDNAGSARRRRGRIRDRGRRALRPGLRRGRLGHHAPGCLDVLGYLDT